MLRPSYTNQFLKDLRRAEKRNKNITKLKAVMIELIEERPLGEKFRDHLLVGNYKGRRECHIEPDWLLIYKLSEDEIIFERTGTHSELFS